MKELRGEPALARSRPLQAAVASAVVMALAALSTPSAVVAAPVPGGRPSCTGQVAGLEATSGGSQVARVGSALGAPLEATVVDSGGCPVSGVDVTFETPGSGASASFAGAALEATVATGTSGVATAPALTANEVTGAYTVTATVEGTYEASFSVTNTTAGAVASVAASSATTQSAQVGTGFPAPLAVTVSDTFGSPVAGAMVAFTINPDQGAGAAFAGGGQVAQAVTDQQGVASSPLLTAGTTAGRFTVTAMAAGAAQPVTYQMTSTAGPAYAISAGAAGTGAAQQAELGTSFPVPLAVTVTDVYGNAVAGCNVTFRVPSSGPGGVFTGWGPVATVVTGVSGAATAPDLSAGMQTGGYLATATVGGVTGSATFALANLARSSPSAPGPAATYRLATSAGKVLVSGSDRQYGLSGSSPAAPGPVKDVVAMAGAPAGGGYWLVTAAGRVYAYGSVRPYGAPAPAHLAARIVGMAATPDGRGYWLVGADGGVFAYGDATYRGSPARLHLAARIVGMAATPDGRGYWLVGAGGGVFAYGDARYHGSPAVTRLSGPVVGIAAAPDGDGYWLATRRGAVFAYGSAIFYGSEPWPLAPPVAAIVRAPSGGYWLVGRSGTVAGFGDAGAQGSGRPIAGAVVAGAV